MKRIAYEIPGGKVHIVHPAPEMFDPNSPTRAMLRSRGIDFQTDAEVLAWIRQKDVPANAVRVVELDEAAIPTRTQRPSFRLP